MNPANTLAIHKYVIMYIYLSFLIIFLSLGVFIAPLYFH